MAICTFFGHRDCPNTIKSRLQETLIDLITKQGVDMFYVGHNGQFDTIVHSTLKQLKAAQFAKKAQRKNKKVINLA